MRVHRRLPSDPNQTPADPIAAPAAEEARRAALSSLYGYSKISPTMLRAIYVALGISLTMNLSLWVYVLIRLPP